MQKEDHHYIKGVEQLHRSTLEFAAIAVLLALGVNLLSSAVPQAFPMTTNTTLGLGVLLLLVGVWYVMLRVVAALSRTIKMEGVLLLSSNNEVREIKRYRFSEKTRNHIKGLTSENKAIAKTWRSANLGFCHSEIGESTRKLTNNANKLVCEAIEYFVLNELTLHLSEYFVSGGRANDDTVVTVERRDIPQLLLDNRFLELFSKDMSEREAFQDHGEDPPGKIVFATGSDGEIYDNFELVLPKGSSLSRHGATLRIHTPRFTMDIDSIFEGYATILPPDFEEFYLGIPFNTVNAQQVNLRVTVRFSWWSVLSSRSWEYFAWLDSFLDRLHESFHFEAFLVTTGWETAHTTAIAVRNAKLSDKNVG